MKLTNCVLAVLLISSVTACGGDNIIDQTCDEPQRYQAVHRGKKIIVPEGLDPLNEFAEMPIPSAEGAPERPKGSRCIELPPTIGSGK
jgi:uncharacterized lipoprotein